MPPPSLHKLAQSEEMMARNMTGSVFTISEALLSLCLAKFYSFRLSEIDYDRSGHTYLITNR